MSVTPPPPPLPPLTPDQQQAEVEAFKTLRAILHGDRVTVYTKPACIQCKLTMQKLMSLDVPFETKDATDPDNLALLQENGVRSAPGVHFRGDWFGGFQPDLLDAIAATLHGPSTPPLAA